MRKNREKLVEICKKITKQYKKMQKNDKSMCFLYKN